MLFSDARNDIVLICVAVSFALWGCNTEHAESPDPPAELPAANVRIATAELSTPLRQIEIMGTIQAAERATIAAKISGNITEIFVTPGSRVRSGESLVSIRAGEISAKVLQAQAQLEQASRNLTREKNLLQKNAATIETVKTLEEAKRIAEAAYKEARTMLSYTSISAPFEGVITKKHANIGDLATPGSPLLQLESESLLEVLTYIPESLILQISIGDELPVFIPAAELEIIGTVKEVAPSADPQSRTAPVKLSLPGNEMIRLGQFARVRLPSTTGKSVLIPVQAIQYYGQMERLFVLEDSRARLRLVKTGLKTADLAEVLSGLAPGEQFIIASDTNLTDGQPVVLQ